MKMKPWILDTLLTENGEQGAGGRGETDRKDRKKLPTFSGTLPLKSGKNRLPRMLFLSLFDILIYWFVSSFPLLQVAHEEPVRV